jgi:hypothetical protein
MSRWIDLAITRRDPAMLGKSGFKRVGSDRYNTEAWVTQALLDHVKFRGAIWEPACGRGDMAEVLMDNGYKVIVSDIAGDRLGCKGAIRSDFLKCDSIPRQWRSIITNPPYTLARAFIEKALELTKPLSGMVAMLMRNEYDCAASRRELFEQECFAAKLVLTKRPKWRDGKHVASPRHNYAFFVWDWRHSGPARIEWLP